MSCPEEAHLTAFALGETLPEHEALAKHIAGCPGCTESIAGLRALGGLLRDALAAEEGPELTPAQRAAIDGGPASARPRRWHLAALVSVAAAALLLTGGLVLLDRVESYERTAGNDNAMKLPPSPDAVYALPALTPAAPARNKSILDGIPLAEPGAVRVEMDFAAPVTDLAEDHQREAYDRIVDNPFRAAAQHPLSTFSIDVDRAAYANVRRFLTNGQLPPPDAVRIEELVNYFSYADPAPAAGGPHPLRVSVEVAGCPWQREHRLVRVALRGQDPLRERPASNLVFLLDVSGSMQSANKLPLLVAALRLLVSQLDERDTVSIVVYAGAAGLVLPPTSCAEPATILAALEGLRAGGSTNGGAGIELAYRLAVENFVEGGINRVVLATDGDFNVGISDRGQLTRLLEEKAASGVFLSILGFGRGNYQDATLEELSNRGNGHYAYIDSLAEARKILGREMLGSLWTIAKDVKLQLEFNPARVAGYRLLGYENRMLAAEDFNDDQKDAGELGVGHSVVAYYQVVPAGVALPGAPEVDPLRYGPGETVPADSPELLYVKLRYKEPASATSQLLEQPVVDLGHSLDGASPDFKFGAAVAAFGMVLRDSPHKGGANLGTVAELASEGRGPDPDGERAEFLELVAKARALQ